MKDLIERLENQARDNVLRGYASGLDGEKFIYEKWAASDLQIVAALHSRSVEEPNDMISRKTEEPRNG